MNRSIRRIALGLALVFAALFANLNVIQLARSDKYTKDPLNARSFYDLVGRRRGEILAADGTVLAKSYRVKDPRFRFRRRYPLGPLFAGITGYYATDPRQCHPAGLEGTYGDVLIGDSPYIASNWVDDLLGRERSGNVIRITIDPAVQRVAAAALADAVGSSGQQASAAAIDPRTGAVLALATTSTYDPNAIAGASAESCERTVNELDRRPGKPLLFRATQERFPPGSTMKIIVSAAALQAGMTPGSSIPYRSASKPPGTDRFIHNFSPSACGGTLDNALRQSCNTAFAYVGAERVGGRRLLAMARRFGLDQRPDFDIPATYSCLDAIPGDACTGTILPPAFAAQASIGQYNVRVTAMQMASVGATVANGGFLKPPYLVDQILDPTGAKLPTPRPKASDRIYSKRTAEDLQQMMVNVVRAGTGAVVGFDPGERIGGKTGTAQSGIPGQSPHVWFVAWHARVAVAVVVEHGGRLGSAATGGGVAGPVARAILEKVLAMEKR